MRRYPQTVILLSVALALVLAVIVPARGGAELDDEAARAADRGLEWLVSRQAPDGSWGDARQPRNTAITSFALLAFMARGHLPGQGKYGPEVARGAKFLVAAARPDGYLVGPSGGTMYCHGMATLALAELWGMTGDDAIRPVLIKAVDLIVRCQNPEGGWRYEPAPTGADISVTIMQVMALRAAKGCGLHVPDATLARAIRYIKGRHHAPSGGFGYQDPSGPPGFARSAAGVCALQLAGAYDADEIPRALTYLKENFNTREHFWYGHYYAAHAMHQVGGKDWDDWYGRIRGFLLSKQGVAGDWPDESLDGQPVGPVYQTSIAVIILATPGSLLPIYQS